MNSPQAVSSILTAQRGSKFAATFRPTGAASRQRPANQGGAQAAPSGARTGCAGHSVGPGRHGAQPVANACGRAAAGRTSPARTVANPGRADSALHACRRSHTQCQRRGRAAFGSIGTHRSIGSAAPAPDRNHHRHAVRACALSARCKRHADLQYAQVSATAREFERPRAFPPAPRQRQPRTRYFAPRSGPSGGETCHSHQPQGRWRGRPLPRSRRGRGRSFLFPAVAESSGNRTERRGAAAAPRRRAADRPPRRNRRGNEQLPRHGLFFPGRRGRPPADPP